MKKSIVLLLLPLLLSSCAVLLVGCGGSGQDSGQKGTMVINQPKQEDCNA